MSNAIPGIVYAIIVCVGRRTMCMGPSWEWLKGRISASGQTDDGKVHRKPIGKFSNKKVWQENCAAAPARRWARAVYPYVYPSAQVGPGCLSVCLCSGTGAQVGPGCLSICLSICAGGPGLGSRDAGGSIAVLLGVTGNAGGDTAGWRRRRRTDWWTWWWPRVSGRSARGAADHAVETCRQVRRRCRIGTSRIQ
jgi:hypothetical protein